MSTVVALAAVLAVGAIVTGCGPGGGEGGGSEAARSAADTAPLRPSTLVWGSRVQPDYLNPAVAGSSFATEILDILFLRLVDYGPPPDHAFEPVLAESWELSEDGLDLVYRMRRDVVWEDGVPTTAEDVTFTFDLLRDPQVGYPHRNKLRQIESCEAIDRWTVRFRFAEPSWEPLLDTRFRILPRHILEPLPREGIESWPFNRKPIGNGRWRVREWAAEERLVLEASETSALGRPHFDRLVFLIIPEETTMRTELLTGGVDVVHRHPSRFYREDSARPELTFLRVPDRGYTYIGWNLRNPLFGDPRVREALTLAVDRQTIIDAFRDGFGHILAAPLYYGHPDFNPDVVPLPFDPTRAAALLDEAGWAGRDPDGVRTKDGRRFEFTYMLSAGNEISEEIATMTEAEFRKLGIRVRAEFFEWTVFLGKLASKEFEATVLARRNDLVYDPENSFHSRGIEDRYNDISFADSTIDRIIDQGKATRDRAVRRGLWHEFQAVMHDRRAMTVLYSGESSYPVRNDKVADPVIDVRGALRRVHEWHPVEKNRK